MKCKYCGTKISFKICILYFGKCFYCDRKLQQPEWEKKVEVMNKQEKDSDKYWKERGKFSYY